MKTLPPPPSNPGGYLPASQMPMASTHVSSIDDFDDYWSSSRPDPDPPAWSLPQRLQDQPWYLGRIKRIDAVNLLRRDGDFLVRDSISNPGEYVLTGQCRGEAMHFEINRLRKDGVDKYHFEGEHFPSIVDLIQFYLNHRRQVTASSRFVLIAPVNTNRMPSESSTFSRNGLLAELEAAYAPFMSKQSSTLTRPTPQSLTQTAILNQAKKRLNGSEHDLSFLAASTSNVGSISGSKSFIDLPMSSHLKVTSFGTDFQSTAEETFVPPVSSRPVPKFSPPKPVPSCITDLDDYDDLDYDKMEPTTLHRSPPAIPPKPANLSMKRHSEVDEASMRASMGQRKHSAHSLHQTEMLCDGFEQTDSAASQSYLDRAQSCSNLVYRQRTKSVKDDDNIDHRRYPSVKIDPAPLLPSRSRTSLGSMSALAISPPDNHHHDTSSSTSAGSHDDTFDYDDLKTSPKSRNEDYHDPDYDDSRKPSENSLPKPISETPKPKTFAQLRAASQPARQVRYLLSFLSSVPPAKLSLLITIEDIKIFQLNPGKATESLRSLFLVENKALRDDILDRNACLQLTVSNTIQKSTTPKALFKVWVTSAQHLLQKVGNGFAFGAVLSALKTEVSRKPKLLVDADAATVAIYRSLVPIYDDFTNGQMPKSVAGCFLPFIQPLLQLLSKSDYVHTGRIKNMHNDGIDQLDLLSNMIHLSRHVLFENASKLDGNLKTMEQAASPLGAAINPLSTESLVHCLLLTSTVGNDFKDLERRKIRQLYEQNF
uniref:SH2 domain-containing protein n=1 Tax=Panagrellus redivivus TaxID=6233 RepID=A0A7E4VMK7_PANRE